MKKYRLKQWYPSLGGDFEVQDIVYFDRIMGCYVSVYDIDISLRKREVENNPDFWELIEEQGPLFITEDGEKHFDKDFAYGINTHNLSKTFDNEWRRDDLPNYKVFKHESNADEYIWRNKRLFSYNDMVMAKKSVILDEEDIVRAAKERMKA